MTSPGTTSMRRRVLLGICLLLAAAGPLVGQSNGFTEDFETYSKGDHPAGWFDSAPGNPVEEAPGEYKIWDDPSQGFNVVFGKKGAANGFTHQHDHLLPSVLRWTGRLLRTHGKGHLGLTFLSSFPEAETLTARRCCSADRVRSLASLTTTAAAAPSQLAEHIGRVFG